MKIAFFTHYPELYGANRSLLNLIDGLSVYDDIELYAICPEEGEITKALKSRHIPLSIFPMEKWIYTKFEANDNFFYNLKENLKLTLRPFKHLYLNLILIKPLLLQLKEWDIDVIYTNSSVIPIGIIVARLLKIPHVWHLREFCDLDYGFSFDWGLHIHRKIIQSSDACITVSKAIQQHFFPDNNSQKVHLIYNGVASEIQLKQFYQENEVRKAERHPYTFLIIGLIHPCKGQEEAIKAFSLVINNFPTTRLFIVGSGNQNYLNHLKKLTQDLNLEENIDFLGYVSNPNLIYQKVDCVLMCSQNEAMGRVTVEGMSACKPVIGYDSGGTSELVEHGKTGLLYSGSYQQLASQMLFLLNNRSQANEIAQNAWETAYKKFTTEAYAKSVYKVLSSL